MPELFNNDTNKQGLIVYGGESSSDYGMVVAEAPAYERPKRKETIYNVPGRNGSIIFQEDAWEDVNRSYKVWLAPSRTRTLTQRVDALEAWLNSKTGYVRLEDNFEPDVYRLAYYSGGDGFSNSLTQYGEATLSFTCRPERFLKSAESAITVTNGDSISNPTRYASKPLIHIEGVGTVKVSINGVTITAKDITDYINIDCYRMNAYRLASENKNSKVSGTFPKIEPGANSISITGTTTLVTITPRYFTI